MLVSDWSSPAEAGRRRPVFSNMVVLCDVCSNLSYLLIILFSVLLSAPYSVEGAIKRCFMCRSRGDLGSCKDPFQYNNATVIEKVVGVQVIPCASGWCGKILEGGANQFKDEEYGVATERLCLQRGPSDDEERCAPAAWGNSNAPKVQMCFCRGDLCNSASTFSRVYLNSVAVIGVIVTVAVHRTFF